MAMVWAEPGGDADFGIGLWPASNGGPAVATDFVHGGHIKSIKMRPGTTYDYLRQTAGIADAGGRCSFWIYMVTLPVGTGYFIDLEQTLGNIAYLYITSTGVLTLASDNGQIGSNGSTLSTGQWYRITFTWKITSTTVNRFEIFLNGVSNISGTNATLPGVGATWLTIGNLGGDTTFDFRLSDIYTDNSNALTDPGNIWVTAKRPNANGTTNGFTTQIGSGGSGYGSGHSPQVNERANSDTNGWSIVTVATAITEEYNIESVSQGDIDITGATIVDYMGWLRTKALTNETAQIILNNVNTNISITSTIAFYTKIAGSSTYPAGTGTDIGEISAGIATTISLYEAGVIVAYIPSATTTSTSSTSSSSSTSSTSSSTSSTSSSTSSTSSSSSTSSTSSSTSSTSSSTSSTSSSSSTSSTSSSTSSTSSSTSSTSSSSSTSSTSSSTSSTSSSSSTSSTSSSSSTSSTSSSTSSTSSSSSTSSTSSSTSSTSSSSSTSSTSSSSSTSSTSSSSSSSTSSTSSSSSSSSTSSTSSSSSSSSSSTSTSSTSMSSTTSTTLMYKPDINIKQEIKEIDIAEEW